MSAENLKARVAHLSRSNPTLTRLRRLIGKVAIAPPPPERAQLDDLLARGVVTVGRRTYSAFRVAYYHGDQARLTVGSFCSIAADVEFIPGGNHRTDWVTTYPVRYGYGMAGALQDGHPASKGDIVVGNDVWIGRGARVLSGVHIGDGAVVGAYSVVTRDVEPYDIVAGNPARRIGARFPPEVCTALIDIAWWDWDDDAIQDAVDLFCSPDVTAFISRFGGAPA